MLSLCNNPSIGIPVSATPPPATPHPAWLSGGNFEHFKFSTAQYALFEFSNARIPAPAAGRTPHDTRKYHKPLTLNAIDTLDRLHAEMPPMVFDMACHPPTLSLSCPPRSCQSRHRTTRQSPIARAEAAFRLLTVRRSPLVPCLGQRPGGSPCAGVRRFSGEGTP